MSKIFEHFSKPPQSNKCSSKELEEFWNSSFSKIEPGSSLSEIELKDQLLQPDQFPTFSGSTLQETLQLLLKDVKTSKTPTIVIVCASAIRCVNLLKELDQIKKNHKIAKLFAKHIKIHEQKAFLKNNSVPIAIGTPARLSKLAEDFAGFADGISYLVVDCGYKDLNGRNIFQIQETRNDLFKFVHSAKMLQLRPEVILL